MKPNNPYPYRPYTGAPTLAQVVFRMIRLLHLERGGELGEQERHEIERLRGRVDELTSREVLEILVNNTPATKRAFSHEGP